MIIMAGEKRKYTTITIPSALFGKIERQIKNTGFSSVSDYATYVLREIAANIEADKHGKRGRPGNEGVMGKLSALGYI